MDGQEVQYQYKNNDDWRPLTDISMLGNLWIGNYKFRLPPVAREYSVMQSPEGGKWVRPADSTVTTTSREVHRFTLTDEPEVF